MIQQGFFDHQLIIQKDLERGCARLVSGLEPNHLGRLAQTNESSSKSASRVTMTKPWSFAACQTSASDADSIPSSTT
nr:hypothetical protein [Rhodoferax sp. UBA5149]